NSHNCTGWGIHSAGTLRYSSYEEAIADWCKGFSENYLNEGLTTPDLVVKRHTPHSPIDQDSGRQVWAIKAEHELNTLMNGL
ncbi:hypothetical protein KKD62_03475, partial [Patescibacteria group bacterium]|nr:hypothetical protein [Patescibacteria group bacterium]MBU1931863.1 hypothetical protein [Patescibacteria group bacterium]